MADQPQIALSERDLIHLIFNYLQRKYEIEQDKIHIPVSYSIGDDGTHAGKMTQLDEAISRYHRILESEPYRDLRWVKNLQEQMEARQLSAGGRLLCPFLRPNFVTQKQYDNLVKTGEALISAVDRMLRTALASPQLLSRMQLFPAEKMLAAIDPGYEMSEVSAQLDLQIQNGSLHVMQYNADALTGAAWSEGLSDLFYDCPPVKEFRRRYNLTRVGGKKPFLSALLKAYKMFAAALRDRSRSRISRFSNSAIQRGAASTRSIAIISAPKDSRPNWFRPINWNIATACCAAAISTSI